MLNSKFKLQKHYTAPLSKETILILFFWVFFIPSIFGQQIILQSPAATKFYLYTPPGYSHNVPAPLLISLHGGSAISPTNDINTLIADSHQTPVNLINNLASSTALHKWDTSLPFVVVSPQLPKDSSLSNPNDQEWPATLIDEVLEYAKTLYTIDQQQIYITGISLGGAGAWNYAATYPDKIAGLVPIGGKSDASKACLVKDIPVWAFHGENDRWVLPAFSSNMVEAINACAPKGLYSPKLNLLYTRTHQGWNEVYNLTNGYDIYSWLLNFRKNEHTNKSPFVFAGRDKTVLEGGNVSIYGEYFDSDGVVSSVQWTRINDGPPVTLTGTATPFLTLLNPTEGTYEFKITVTDNLGAFSSDTMKLTVRPSVEPGVPSVTQLILTNAAVTDIRPITEDMVINTNDDGAGVNIRANGNNMGSVVFSVNGDQHTRAANNPYTIVLYNLADVNSNWTLSPGTYLVCATPYSNNDGKGTKGISLCRRVTVTREAAGDQTFYAKDNSDISQLSSWGTNFDGTGTAPVNFTSSQQYFVVASNARIDAALVISGQSSRLSVLTNGVLTISSPLTSPLHVQGTGVIKINTPSGTAISSLSAISTVIYEPNVTNIPFLTFGNLIIRGNGGSKVLATDNINVRSNLLIENVILNGHNGNKSRFEVEGNVAFEGPTTPNGNNSFGIIFKGVGIQNLNTNHGLTALRDLIINKPGISVHVNSPNSPAIIQVGIAALASRVFIINDARLVLNGHTLSVVNNASINPNNEKGQIDLENSTLLFNTNSATSSNIYPVQGRYNLKILDVSKLGTGGIHIQDSLMITEYIKSTNGTIYSNGNITLWASENFTAYVKPITGTGSIDGVVNFQRLIEPGRKYKYLAFPVQNQQVIHLQEHIPVTGNFPQTSVGTDLAANPSLYYFHEPSSGWQPYPTTSNTQPLEVGKGYSIFIREDNEPTRLVLSGALHQGNFDFPLTADPNVNNANDGWNLIGNPYASPIKWQADGWTRSGVNNTIYVRDNRTPPGRFLLWDGTTGDAEFGGVVASGQSFWVRTTTANPQLTITENAKVDAGAATLFRTGADVEVLEVMLKQDQFIDKTYVKFSGNGAFDFDTDRDAVKKMNDFFNLGTLSSDGVAVAIKNLPTPGDCSEKLSLYFEPGKKGQFSLSCNGTALNGSISKVILLDHYLNSAFDLTGERMYTFNVSDDSRSFSTTRFQLQLETHASTPPVITLQNDRLVSPSKQGNQWIFNGSDIEGATDATYLPLEEGDYQLRVFSKGCDKISDVFAFRITDAANPLYGEVRLYPNPASNQIKISGLSNASDVTYSITSMAGAMIQQGKISGDALASEAVLELQSFTPGLYLIKIKDGSKSYQLKFAVR